jgi:formylglycine-generating enzyme required for sulfatase activity
LDTESIDGLIGQTVAGRYRIESELGGGGMGSVYRARDIELNERQVVLKFPHEERLSDPVFRLRFLDEIRSLASLDHPHIIKIHDAGETDRSPFAVVQWVGGGDLKDRLDDDLQSAGECADWMGPVADALDFVHRNGFCHRDVKPANIFFDEEGHAFLSDFGIATVIDQVDSDETMTDKRHTAIGSIVGSAIYCPPEAVRRQLSPAYDQYSLAVTVYECLSGEIPVEAETAMDLVLAKNNVRPREIGEHFPELPERCSKAIMRALSIDPADRFPSCRDFYLEYAAGLEEAAPTAWDRLSTGARIGGLLAAGGLLVVGALWAFRDAGPGLLPRAGTERVAGPFVLEELHQVSLGSTPDEFRDALGLCRLYDSSCDPSWFTSESPTTSVLAPFALDLHEASTGEFEKFAESTGYVTTAEKRGHSYHNMVEVPGRTWRNPDPEREDAQLESGYPVVHVSFFDATAFCEAHGMRLPTQEEWEHAARGDDRRIFPWGDSWDEARVVYGGRRLGRLEPVNSKSKGATPLGHLHMSGNVAEWTATAAGGERIIKGGSWSDPNPAFLRPAARTSESPDFSSSDLGFRCVADAAD